MKLYAELMMVAAIIGCIAVLTLTGCVPSDAGQCKPHTFQLGC